MANKLMDPIGRLMGLRYKSHPWHGVELGLETGQNGGMISGASADFEETLGPSQV